MNTRDNTIDLRHIAANRLQMAAFQAVTELQRGERIFLLTGLEPTLMMHSLNLQLRHRLNWQVIEEAPGKWKVSICRREDVAPASLMDILSRDHQRLDELFGLSLQLVNAGKVSEGIPLIMEFSDGLKRHVHVENDILVPAFRGPDTGPVATMLREHDDILAQMTIIESYCSDGDPVPAWELSPFLAILSGTMAKHENREEQNLFPQWDLALRHASPEDKEALMARVGQELSGMPILGLDFGTPANP
ncbi:MAG TPA: hemerythrin domain-containing protein [Burkholderiales bacterium]|nr:hemerythrin domain-containing protein [Burkholderiales bacterium]